MVDDKELTGDTYKKVGLSLDDWLGLHADEPFTTEDIARYHEWREKDTKRALSLQLYYRAHRQVPPSLEKKGRFYRVIDSLGDELRWWDANVDETLDLRWPRGVEDGTTFGLERAIVPPGSVIVIAGESNKGKTAWCLNFLIENMDRHSCLYMTNEPGGLVRRLQKFDWIALVNDTRPKFRVVRRFRNYEDIMIPNGINIIDYLNIEGEAYSVKDYIKRYQEKLDKGLVVVALQKNPGRDMGVGGWGTLDAASLYISIGKELLKVVKSKETIGTDLNGAEFSFKLVHYGTKFHDIQPVDKSSRYPKRAPEPWE